MNKLLTVGVIAVLLGIFGVFPSASNNVAAVDSAGNPVVLIFTIDKCPPCKSMVKLLKKRNVSFKEKKVNPADQDSENAILWKKMGKGGFPLIASGKERVIGGSKSSVASLLGINFGDKHLTRREKKYYSKHFYGNGKPKVVLYGADWCGYCKKLKSEFNDNNINYKEIDVEKRKDRKKLTKTMEINGYPTVWVGYDKVEGSNYKAVKKALDKI